MLAPTPVYHQRGHPACISPNMPPRLSYRNFTASRGAARRHNHRRTISCRAQRFESAALAFWSKAVSLGQAIRKIVLQTEPRQLISESEGQSATPPKASPEDPSFVSGRSDSSPDPVSAATTTTTISASGGFSRIASVIANERGIGARDSDAARASYSQLVSGLRDAPQLQVQVVDSISKVSSEEWDAVAASCQGGEVNPFLLWSFLHALEESGSAAPRTGWLPQHILVREADAPAAGDRSTEGAGPVAAEATPPAGGAAEGGRGRLVGCVPMYLKGHSFGEYVFDSSWANYAEMLGVRYYPKLQAAVPFTPVTGPRMLVAGNLAPALRAAVVRTIGRTLIDMSESLGLSGVHLTFTTAQEWAALAELGFKQRLGIQFHWDNAGYTSFDAFLADLKQSKRKSIRQERKSIERAGLTAHRLPGAALTPAHWDRFYSFYLTTVDRKWGNAYLTREFFHCLGENLRDRVLLVVASEGGPQAGPDVGADPQLQASPSAAAVAPPPDRIVAAALNLVGSHALFGRNWGQAEGRDYKNLHFELCYYQALEEAIARGLPRVEAGAQGEHKLQRGYLPSFTYSCHYIRDPRLGYAVDKFLQRERVQIEYTLQMMSVTASPYKKERTIEALVSKLQAYSSLSSGSSLDAEEAAVLVEGSGYGM